MRRKACSPARARNYLVASPSSGLVSSAVSGDQDAIQSLLVFLHPIVRGYCLRRLGHCPGEVLAEIDDCSQEVLLAVLQGLPGYRYRTDRFLAFVFGIAGHKVADVHRRQARNRADPLPETSDGRGLPSSAIDDFERVEEHLQVSRLMSALPEHQRAVLALRIIFGFSAEETAKKLALPSAGAVRVAQHRALLQLRDTLAGTPDFPATDDDRRPSAHPTARTR